MADHCVKICLNLSEVYGSSKERESIQEFTEKLGETIENHGVGEFDGDEYGGGECTLYMYGPDADQLFEVISPVVTSFPLARGGYVLKRYGPPNDGIKEVKVDL